MAHMFAPLALDRNTRTICTTFKPFASFPASLQAELPRQARAPTHHPPIPTRESPFKMCSHLNSER